MARRVLGIVPDSSGTSEREYRMSDRRSGAVLDRPADQRGRGQEPPSVPSVNGHYPYYDSINLPGQCSPSAASMVAEGYDKPSGYAKARQEATPRPATNYDYGRPPGRRNVSIAHHMPQSTGCAPPHRPICTRMPHETTCMTHPMQRHGNNTAITLKELTEEAVYIL